MDNSLEDTKRNLRIEARQFFADHKWSDFYSAVAYSGYKHATEKQAEVMAEFALTIYARGLADGLERAAKMIERQYPALLDLRSVRDEAAKIRGEK